MRHVKTRFTVVTFTAVVLLGLWSVFDTGKQEQADIEPDPHFVDAFMRDFTMTQMDTEGKPGYVLRASYLEHYNDTDESVITNPLFNISDAETRWKISAMQGKIGRGGTWLVLNDDVVMQQTDTPVPIRLETSRLRINTATLTADTDRPVKIHRDRQQITSHGMEYSSRSGILEFRSRVRGIYDLGDKNIDCIFRLPAWIFLAAVMTFTGLGRADTDTPQPVNTNLVHIRADNMKYDMKSGVSSYTGNVRITHNDMELEGDAVTLKQQGSEIEQLSVTGKPARYRQTTENGETIIAESLGMTYSTTRNQLVLTDNARLEQAGHIVESQRITYDTELEVVIAGQINPQDRVNITLTPKKEKPGQQSPTPESRSKGNR